MFAHLAEAGELPNISRHVLEPGGMVPATTVFPSTTGVAYLPFLTGCYPGTCDVPGIRWMDRARYAGRWWRDREHVRSYCGYQGRLLSADVRPGIRSLFDLVPDAVGICTVFGRGLEPGRALAGRARILWGGLAHYTAGYSVLERAVGRALCRTATARPRLVFAVFPGVDGVTHFHDPWHPAVLDTYREFDEIVGRYAGAGGFEGDHLTFLVSDHGLSEVERHTDVALELEAAGLPTLRHPLVWRRAPRAAVMVSGNASCQVYLRPGVTRAARHAVAEIEAGAVPGIPGDLVARLVELPGVALVAGTDGDDVTVVGRGGRAGLRVSDDEVSYTPDGGDVLGLGGAATRSDREWLAHSLEGPYPDAPIQLTQVFRSQRAGDLVVIAERGTDLRRDWEVPEHRSGHGSLITDHMRCLAAANVPLQGPLRTVDVFATILDWLGCDLPEGIDSVVPAVAARA